MLDKDCFREVNKMAKVFDIEWLSEDCSDYFEDLVDELSTNVEEDEEDGKPYTYQDMLYLFEESSYVYIVHKQHNLINFVFEKIGSKEKSKDLFLTKYLEDIEDLSTGKLDLIVKLAGTHLPIVVQSFTTKLKSHLSTYGALLPDIFRHFLDSADLRICRTYNKVAFEELFDVLQDNIDSRDELRWVLCQYRKSCEDCAEVSLSPFQFKSDSEEIDFPTRIHDMIDRVEDLEPFVMNLFADEDVVDMITFAEAMWRFADNYPSQMKKHAECKELKEIVKLVKEMRCWSSLPSSTVKFYQPDWTLRSAFHDFLRDCGAFEIKDKNEDEVSIASVSNRVKISCINDYPEEIKVTFRRKEDDCEMEGKCGFMFKTNPNTDKRTFVDLLKGIKLITDKTLYPDNMHIHDYYIEAVDLHFLVEDKQGIVYPVTPGLCSNFEELYQDWEKFDDLNKECYLQVVYGL